MATRRLASLFGAREDSQIAAVWGSDSSLGNNAEVLGGLAATDERPGLYRLSGSAYGSGGLAGRRAHAPDLDLGIAQVRGALDKDVIRRVIRRHLNELKFCYEKELLRKRSLRGELVLSFTIDGSGAVVEAHIRSSVVNDAAVESCAVSAVRGWEFPKPASGGISIVSYPLQFKIAN